MEADKENPSHHEHDTALQHANEELYKRNAELAVRNKTLALLRKLDEISLAAVNTSEMATKITAAIAEELGYELVSLAIVQEETKLVQWLSFSSAIDWITQALKTVNYSQINVVIDHNVVSQALQESKTNFTEQLNTVFPPKLITVLQEAQQKNASAGINYSLLQPLRFGEQTLGLLTVSSSRNLKNLSRYEQESITGTTGLVALALYKAKIYEDLQKTSAQLAVANKQLTELDKAKSEFLSIASHQLYTPLTALRGYLSMLLEGDFGKVSDQQQPVFSILNSSTDKLITLIKNLLDISRIESGRLELNLQSLDLGKMVDDLVQTLYPNVTHKGLKMTFHHPVKDFPHIVGDEQRLRQVFLNFIDNAIKYTDKGHIDIGLEQVGDDVMFSVTDTGKGMSEEDTARLFNKFTRVGGASRYHTEGTGLGLYVAKQIVREHHGDVMAVSPGEGKGSTFSVRLPREDSARSLKVGTKASVVIKAADAQKKA